MESQEQRESGNKLVAVIIAVIVVAGAAFAAYKTGIIPGFGDGNKVAQELKADTESLKGNNLQTKVVTYLKSDKLNASATPEQKKKFNEDIDKIFADSTISFDYSDIGTSSGEGKGTITIVAPKLNIASKADSNSAEVTAPQFVVSRSVAYKNDYFFHSDGNLDIYASANGTRNKVVSIAAEVPENEVKFDDAGNIVYTKSSAKNVQFIEGRGNTVLFTVGDAHSEGGQKKQGNNIDAYAKLDYKNIVPGDMIKLMLGSIDPLSLNLDYAYKGENPGDYLNQMAQSQNPDAAPNAQAKPFDGNLALNNFAVMMGNAGISANAKLVFRKDNPKAIPSGVINLKIAQYQKLIDYFRKFSRVPQEAIDNSIKFLSEIGQNNGSDIAIDVKLDGTENVLIGGKTMAQIKTIGIKYYPSSATPKTPAITSPDSVEAAPPAAVTGQPIVENGTKI